VILAATETSTLLVELGGVLLLLAVAGRLARRIAVSPIPLYLAAGLILGDGGLVDLDAATEFMETGGEVGVILLLLMLGLEYTSDELIAGLRTSRWAGLLDLALNATPGVLTGYLLGWDTVEALFLGGITYISSSGVVAKVLDELGRIGNRETPTVLSLLIFEDLVMAVFLPVAAGLAIASGAADTVRDVGVALAAVALAFAAARLLGDRLSRLVFNQSGELLMLSVLGGALLIAGTAEELQAPAAVAALLVGIALSGPAADSSRRVLTPLRDLFAALFFVSFAIGVDPGAIPDVLPEAAALAIVTAGTKVAAGVAAAKRAGLGLPARLRAGTVLVARGEFSIIIAGVAVAEGLEPDLATLAATYVLILASVGPVLTRFADPIADRLRDRDLRGAATGRPTA
jgi:monovalent cation:H+ antiporter-2, CPA2 family